MRLRAGPVVAACAVVGVLGLAVIPAQAYREQQRHRGQLAATFVEMSGQNRGLEQRAERLATDAEIERLARLHYNLAKPGEEIYAILPEAASPPAPPAPAPVIETRPSWWHRTWGRISSVL